ISYWVPFFNQRENLKRCGVKSCGDMRNQTVDRTCENRAFGIRGYYRTGQTVYRDVRSAPQDKPGPYKRDAFEDAFLKCSEESQRAASRALVDSRAVCHSPDQASVTHGPRNNWWAISFTVDHYAPI